jgi:A/G-specific adenine glycosylase
VARQAGTPEAFPVKTKKLRRGRRSSALLWLRQDGQTWLVQRPPQGVWAGLWSLPEFESPAAAEAQTVGWAGRGEWLPSFKHVLTHFDWMLQPLAWTLPPGAAGPALANGRWFTALQAGDLGLPAPVRRLLVS